MNASASVSELLAAAGERLTATERRLAEVVLAEPSLLAFGTVSELAERAGTSRPSVVRFAHKLGFGGFSELQAHVREGISEQLLRPGQRIRRMESGPGPVQAALEGALQSLFEVLTPERLDELCAPILKAPQVWILTGETSRAGAHALHSGLTLVRPGVHLVEEHSSGRDLGNARRGDAAVVLDFARYRRHSVQTAAELARLGVRVVAITDGPLSPLVAIAEAWCGLRVPPVGPFDSSVPAVAAAELIVARVAAGLRETARRRIDRTEALWQASGIYLD